MLTDIRTNSVNLLFGYQNIRSIIRAGFSWWEAWGSRGVHCRKSKYFDVGGAKAPRGRVFLLFGV